MPPAPPEATAPRRGRSLRDTARGYGSVNRALHWLIAVLILTAIGLGLFGSNLPRTGAEAVARVVQVFSVHKTVGIAVLFLALLRILWVAGQIHPHPLHPERRVETWLASSVHWALYGGMVLMPLSGWLLHSAAPGEGFAQILWPFGQRLPGVPQDRLLMERAESFHTAGWWLLAGLIALHVAGALKHALVDRDATLARMAGAQDRLPQPPTTPRGNRWLAPLTALALWLGFAAVYAVPHGAAPAGAPPAPAPPAAEAPVPASQAAPSQIAPTAPAAIPGWTVTEGTLAIGATQSGSPITGSFAAWTADIAYDPTPGTGHVEVEIDISSLQLGAVAGTATGPDFLNVAAHPTARFSADIARAAAAGSTAHQATGTLTIAGQSRPAVLPFDLTVSDGTARAQGSLTLDRRDFGIGAGYPDESTVGFAVPVTVDLTAARQ